MRTWRDGARHLLVGVTGLGALGFLPACSTGSNPFSADPARPVTTVTELRRATAGELHIRLDPSGRPYDTEILEGREDTAVTFEAIGELHVPGGHLRVMDGNSLEVDPWFFRDGTAAVEFGPAERLDLGIHWEVWPHGSGGPRSQEDPPRGILGVRLDVPGTEVTRWGALEPAYGTDGGVGGITSQSTIDAAKEGWDGESHAIDYGYFEDQFAFYDWDGIPGDESFIFVNGRGDGGFPMARGYDAEDRLVSLIVWDPRQPWRLAVADGTPPGDVTEREDQLLACMQGTRPFDNHGYCMRDE